MSGQSTRPTGTAGTDGRIAGCVMGIVADIDDPEGQGRIKVTYPWLDGQTLSNWAPIAAPMAGAERGLFAMPELDDEAVLSFDRGRMDHPIVLGFTWNGQDATPDPNTSVRVWRSVQGHQLMMADSNPGGGAFGLMMMGDAHGNMVTMANGVVTVKAVGALRLKAASITFEVAGQERNLTPNRKPI